MEWCVPGAGRREPSGPGPVPAQRKQRTSSGTGTGGGVKTSQASAGRELLCRSRSFLWASCYPDVES